jgi:two-component system CheB/CheR fusion protein
LGAEAIKAAGGITFAQDESAQQGSMPHSAIESGCIDFVLPPEAIAAELERIAKHPYLSQTPPQPEHSISETKDQSDLNKILALLHEALGIDFTGYRSTTLYRRISRRMVLHRLDTFGDYLSLLTNDASELQSLTQDILISVTAFFRDPACYDTIKSQILPEIFADRSRTEPVRVWVVGCAGGEEAYSLAITITEYQQENGLDLPVQIFATDLNENEVIKARTGQYPKSIAEDVSPERLRQFFVETDSGYQVVKRVREMCVFARQNALADPPFSRLDLVSCRNLLIYMQPVLQKRLIPLLHYSLRAGGFLWLGGSENISGFGELFDIVEPRQKIFRRKQGMPTLAAGFPIQFRWPANDFPRPQDRSIERGAGNVQHEADRLALAKYSPPSVVLNASFEVQQFRGDINPYLALPHGRPTTNILKMAREGLLVSLRNGLEQARSQLKPVRLEKVRISSDSGFHLVNLEILPFRGAGPEQSYLVFFEETERQYNATVVPTPAVAEPQDEVAHLQRELAATREYMQALIEQQEAGNEELQSANEEIQSSNEELQSVNEELQTSKEEVQSSNEELLMVNEELRNRNQELDRARNDLANFIASSDLPMVAVDTSLRIRNFSPAAEKLLNLIGPDIGRSIGEFRFVLDVPDLEQLLTAAIREEVSSSREVQDRRGQWYLMRIRPYRTGENKIDGAVLILVDIERLKESEEQIRTSEEKYRLLIEGALGIAIVLLDKQGNVTNWNIGAERLFGYSSGEIIGHNFSRLMTPEDIAHKKLVRDLADAEAEGETTNDHWLMRRDGTRFWASGVTSALRDKAGLLHGFAKVLRDQTERRQYEESLREEDTRKDEFLATLGHELRNPLAPLTNTMEALSELKDTPPAIDRALKRMQNQVETLKRLVEDILDVSRINNRTVQLRREVLDLRKVIQRAIETERHEITAAQHVLSTRLPNTPVMVEGDQIRLEQIVTNVLNNAIHYTDPGGQIALSLEVDSHKAESREAILSIKDSGIGIPPEQLDQLFKLFARGEASHTRNRWGLGVGLSLVKGLVELHGGSVEARSAGAGQGSEFIVRLPVVSGGSQETTNTRPLRPQRKPDSVVRRVLIVDDNQDAAEALGDLLRLWNQDVRVAFDGSQAIEVAKEFRPDVILLDVRMPGMNGYDVVRQLRGSNGFEQATIVALSGYGTDEDRRRSLQAGFDAHIVKPIDKDALVRILQLPAKAGTRSDNW